jgi:S1-C subfamily serine protease
VEKNVALDHQAAMEMIQISGQQGVPVITVDGQVVIGFNQPRLAQLLQQAKPKLGASIADAASQVQKHPGIPSSGAYVGQMRPGSPAERAGLRSGDVITALGGQAVQCAADVHRLISRMPKNRDIPLTYVRDGQDQDTWVRL